ncbi:phasin family protein [Bradyrhizobium cenepequi]|uniref:phasin family protein n=1 Tax=Bradyrhizobium cenepequi TaxID=2821403 RepID=UPI001CE24DF2|nr:phasin family protein [Bradyrhizobium cenepequi]MCA6106816.1 phasin family protein [Bradyrhizobium cenepequi]
MANPRHEDKSTQAAEDAVRRVSEKTAEQTRRIGENAAEASQEMARASTDLLRQNAEAVQSALRFGLDMTTAAMGRSTDELGHVLGLSEEAQRAAERSAHSTSSVFHSTTAIAKGMSGMSQEYLAFVRHQIESSMSHMNELWRCRTPQDVVAVQSDFVRETMENAVESGRRMADMSLKAADDTAKRMAQTIERRAA